ncbi:UNVERIFIED_CONTAM: hypothetical protein NCL1_54798 [Trichonephila clavipes]
MLQELKPHDDTLRMDVENFVQTKISEDETSIQSILWTDEAHFTLSVIIPNFTGILQVNFSAANLEHLQFYYGHPVLSGDLQSNPRARGRAVNE